MEPVIPDLRDVPRQAAYAQLLDIQHLVLEGSNDKPLFRSFRVGFRCASSGIPE